jgi:hypothetical protein
MAKPTNSSEVTDVSAVSPLTSPIEGEGTSLETDAETTEGLTRPGLMAQHPVKRGFSLEDQVIANRTLRGRVLDGENLEHTLRERVAKAKRELADLEADTYQRRSREELIIDNITLRSRIGELDDVAVALRREMSDVEGAIAHLRAMASDEEPRPYGEQPTISVWQR